MNGEIGAPKAMRPKRPEVWPAESIERSWLVFNSKMNDAGKSICSNGWREFATDALAANARAYCRIDRSVSTQRAACKARVEGFSNVWTILDEMPPVDPSPAFEARLRAAMATEPQHPRFWEGIAAMLPSPRLALAVALLGVFSLWQSSRPVAVN